MLRDSKIQLLQGLNIGQRTAEEEQDDLARYFVATEYWRKIFLGAADIVYGNKGTGKSAIYLLVLDHENELFDRNILLVSGENVRGAPAFKDLVLDPPATEREFVNLWKLYIVTLLGRSFREFDVCNEPSKKVQAWLESLGLLDREITLRGIIKLALDYVRRNMRPRTVSEVEAGIHIDPATGLAGLQGKIVFDEPNLESRRLGVVSADEALRHADRALQSAGFSIWILLDRLDVAFADSPDLEKNALRALFRTYRDISDLDHTVLKIFLRNDIWNRVTESGFRESSHITSAVTLEWDRDSLRNLIVRRLVANESLCRYYDVKKDNVLQNAEEQRKLFYRVFPDQVDLGQKKPSSFDWTLSRTADGWERSAPREVIHLICAMRDAQLKRFERGEPGPPGELLFDRTTFKEALPEVSKARLEQTIFAEYPETRTWLLALRNMKTEQEALSLSRIWSISADEADERAAKLVEIGFFQRRAEKENRTYWVPFLYRDALEMVQGKAEEAEAD